MERKIACCGVECSACDAFVATRDDNDALRQKTAATWSRQFDVPVAPEYINCDGCQQSTGGHLEFCCELCRIRPCCLQKGFETCAQCPDYVCEILQRGFEFMSGVLEMGPLENLDARKNLEELRQQYKPST